MIRTTILSMLAAAVLMSSAGCVTVGHYDPVDGVVYPSAMRMPSLKKKKDRDKHDPDCPLCAMEAEQAEHGCGCGHHDGFAAGGHGMNCGVSACGGAMYSGYSSMPHSSCGCGGMHHEGIVHDGFMHDGFVVEDGFHSGCSSCGSSHAMPHDQTCSSCGNIHPTPAPAPGAEEVIPGEGQSESFPTPVTPGDASTTWQQRDMMIPTSTTNTRPQQVHWVPNSLK